MRREDADDEQQWEALRSHQGRKHLRSSVTKNETQFVVPTEERKGKMRRTRSRHDLQAHPSVTATYIRRSPVLGVGSYSVAHTLCTEKGWEVGVGLMKTYEKECLGSMASPYFGVNASANVAQLLWHGISEPGYSPHIITPWFSCVGYGVTNRHRGRGSHSVIQFSERARYGTVRNYIQDLESLPQRGASRMDGRYTVNKRCMTQLVRTIIFQVTYTMDALHQVFPRFRHNDLRDENVLMQIGQRPTTFTSYASRGCTWHVPNMGMSALISDFDHATIPGLQDNYLTLESEFSLPLIACDTRKDHSTDLFVFVSSLFLLIHDKVEQGFVELLQSIWNTQLGCYYTKANCLRPSDIHVLRGLPSAYKVLVESSLFNDYVGRPPSPQIPIESYAVPETVSPMAQPPVPLQSPVGPKDATPFTLTVPLFERRVGEDERHLLEPYPYCYTYLYEEIPPHLSIRTCPQGMAVTYDYVASKYTPQITVCLNHLWHLQQWGPPYLNHDDVDAMGEIIVCATIDLGARFINAFIVPYYYWPAIFAVSYNESLIERNLRRADSWIMENYAEWWLNINDDMTMSSKWVSYENKVIRARATQLLHVSQQWSWWRECF